MISSDKPMQHPLQSIVRTVVVLCVAVLPLLFALALLGSHADLQIQAKPASSASSRDALQAPLPRVQCTQSYTAQVYAQGLSSPDGLAFSPARVLHVAEEAAGRVSQIGPTGEVTPVVTGLTSPEGIAFDDAGTLYVVEDIEAGRLVRMTPDGVTATLAAGFEAPEGIVWTPDDTIYVTESDLQFVTHSANLRTRVAAVSPSGMVTRVITNPSVIHGLNITVWSYAGVAAGPDGLLYVTNETSGREESIVVIPGVLTLTLFTTDSIFVIDPAMGTRTLFTSDLVSPEGLRFSGTGDFPLYVVEEDIGDGAGRLSQVGPDGSHSPLCTGFLSIEDVAVDRRGWLYVSEDASGLIILVKPIPRYGLAIAPSTDAQTGSPGRTVTYTLQVTNTGNVSDTLDVAASGHTWPTSVPTPLGPLAAGTSARTVVTVSIPTSAMLAEVDVATITITSWGDDTKWVTATLTTSARPVLFLPLIIRQQDEATSGEMDRSAGLGSGRYEHYVKRAYVCARAIVGL